MWEYLLFLALFLFLFPASLMGGLVLAIKLMERFMK